MRNEPKAVGFESKVGKRSNQNKGWETIQSWLLLRYSFFITEVYALVLIWFLTFPIKITISPTKIFDATFYWVSVLLTMILETNKQGYWANHDFPMTLLYFQNCTTHIPFIEQLPPHGNLAKDHAIWAFVFNKSSAMDHQGEGNRILTLIISSVDICF